jgi:hypothetical protein
MTPLAQTDLLDSVRRAMSDNPDSGEIAAFALGVFALLLAIAVAARFLYPGHSTQKAQNADFLTLAVDLLGLSERDRRDLLRVAEMCALPYAASMLLSPANLAFAADLARQQGAQSDLLQRLSDLSIRLFDAPLPPGPDADAEPFATHPEAETPV